MTGNHLSIGRNQSTADAVSITEFHGMDTCFRVNISWLDGAYIYAIYTTKDEAMAHVHSLGWV